MKMNSKLSNQCKKVSITNVASANAQLFELQESYTYFISPFVVHLKA